MLVRGDAARRSAVQIAWSDVHWNRVVLIAIIVALLGANTVFRSAYGVRDHSDYTVYAEAGRAVLDGNNIYEAHNSRGWYYVYLPLFAIAMAPLGRAPTNIGSALWFCLSCIALASALIMAVRMAQQRYPALDTRNTALWMVPVALVSPWLISGLTRGQASEVVIWLIIATFYFDQRGQQTWSAAMLGCAALIKAFPLALCVYFVRRGQRTFWLAFIATLLVGTLLFPAMVLGWQRNLDYLEQWFQRVAAPVVVESGSTAADPLHDQLLDVSRQRNQSLQSLFVTAGLDSRQSRTATVFLGSAMLLTMLRLRARQALDPIWSASAFVLWDLLIPPVSESHYFGALLLPLAMVCAASLEAARRDVRMAARAVLAMYLVMVPILTVYKPLQMMRVLCVMVLATWAVIIWKMSDHRRVGASVHG